jgi:hypothetical protein
MNPQDDERWYDAGPNGTDALSGGVDVVVSLIVLPFMLVHLVYRFLRWWLIEWIEDSPWSHRSDRYEDSPE